MVCLPAYALGGRPDLPRPGKWAFVLALALPVIAAAPVVLLLLSQGHPLVRFPPIEASQG